MQHYTLLPPHTYIALTINRLVKKGSINVEAGILKNDIHIRDKCDDPFVKASDTWDNPCVKHWIIISKSKRK